MFGIGMPEMILILAVALIVIGPKKLPDLAKSLGKAMGEFKKATSDLKESMQIDSELKDLKSTFNDLEREDHKKTPAADAQGSSTATDASDPDASVEEEAPPFSAQESEDHQDRVQDLDGQDGAADDPAEQVAGKPDPDPKTPKDV